MKSLHPVSQTLVALEMNLTSRTLFLSDQLEYIVHLPLSCVLLLLPFSLKLWVFEKNNNFLLAHVHTAVRPAFSVILHLQDPSLQCFQLNHIWNVSLIGRRSSQHQLFKFHPYLLWWLFDSGPPEFFPVFDTDLLQDSCQAQFFWAQSRRIGSIWAKNNRWEIGFSVDPPLRRGSAQVFGSSSRRPDCKGERERLDDR